MTGGEASAVGARVTEGKRRLSKAEKKRLAKGLPTGDGATAKPFNSGGGGSGGARGVDVGGVGGAEPFLSTGGAFRDVSHYIGYGLSVAEVERDQFDPNAEGMGPGKGAARSGVEALVAGRLEEGMLDITADETKDMRGQQRVHQWDKRKKKCVAVVWWWRTRWCPLGVACALVSPRACARKQHP